jgi:hypothetical protein
VTPTDVPGGSGRSTPAPTVLHSSLTGVGFSFGGVGLMVALAVLAAFSAGASIVTWVLAVIAAIGAAVVLFDMPISSSFDDEGVTRRALLWHQRLQWDDVDRLARVRKGMLRSSKAAPTGGLIAVRGRRNYTLVDQMEGHAEYLALRDSLGDAGERLGIDRVVEPPIDQPPTWLHRRARWAPDDRGDR